MPVHVDTLDDVASILERLCKSRAGAGPGAAVAATMNFVVFIDDDAHRRWVLERAERIAEKHPSRMIVLDSTHAIKGVDVSCGSSEGTGATIRNERLDLGIAALDHESIVATAHQLTIREIPTVLWWSGARLLESRTFLGLAENADVVVIDSSGKAHDEETLAELCTFAERHPHVALHDLAFLRLAPWQEMIAQFFDDPALRADLFALSAVEIESGSAAEALYLGAWIGSRIAWEALDSNARRSELVLRTHQERGAAAHLARHAAQRPLDIRRDALRRARRAAFGRGRERKTAVARLATCRKQHLAHRARDPRSRGG
jgi:glucose-6-phosphate dehydrogenase assembly protein OpcA